MLFFCEHGHFRVNFPLSYMVWELVSYHEPLVILLFATERSTLQVTQKDFLPQKTNLRIPRTVEKMEGFRGPRLGSPDPNKNGKKHSQVCDPGIPT